MEQGQNFQNSNNHANTEVSSAEKTRTEQHGHRPIKAIVWSIIGLLIVAAILGFLYNYTTRYIQIENTTPPNDSTATNTNGNGTNQNLKSYVFGPDKVTFEYTTNWYPQEKHGRIFFLKQPNVADIPDTEIYAYGQQITIATSTLMNEKGTVLTAAQYDAYVKNLPEHSTDMFDMPVHRSWVTINGISMLRTDYYEYAGSQRVLNYEFTRGSIKYVIRLFPYEPAGSPDTNVEILQNIRDFDQLMSTVRIGL